MVLGDEQQGRALYDAALAEAREVGSPGMLLLILGDYAGWLILANELSLARAYLTEAIALATQHRGLWIAISPILGLALVNAIEGKAAAARQLGAVDGLLERLGMETPFHAALRMERAVELVRAKLDAQTLEAVRAEGRADVQTVMAEAGNLPAKTAPASAPRSTPHAAMTPRERDVLRWLVQGASDKEIAAELGIGVRTVATHVATLRAKLDAPSRSAAAAIAVRESLV